MDNLTEDIKENLEISDSTSEDIELKPKKEKKPYILTDARKIQFEKARQKRMENVEIKKKEKEELSKEFVDKKKELELKKQEVLKKKHTKELLKLQEELEKEKSLVDESVNSDTEIIIKKRKPIQRKRIVYLEDDDDEEEVESKKNNIIINNIYKKPVIGTYHTLLPDFLDYFPLPDKFNKSETAKIIKQ